MESTSAVWAKWLASGLELVWVTESLESMEVGEARLEFLHGLSLRLSKPSSYRLRMTVEGQAGVPVRIEACSPFKAVGHQVQHRILYTDSASLELDLGDERLGAALRAHDFLHSPVFRITFGLLLPLPPLSPEYREPRVLVKAGREQHLESLAVLRRSKRLGRALETVCADPDPANHVLELHDVQEWELGELMFYLRTGSLSGESLSVAQLLELWNTAQDYGVKGLVDLVETAIVKSANPANCGEILEKLTVT